MALEKSYTSPQYGFTATNAYHHITDIRFNKDGTGACSIAIFYNADARWNEKNILASVSFSFAIDDLTLTGTPMADVYTYLKTLPEFAGALDV